MDKDTEVVGFSGMARDGRHCGGREVCRHKSWAVKGRGDICCLRFQISSVNALAYGRSRESHLPP